MNMLFFLFDKDENDAIAKVKRKFPSKSLEGVKCHLVLGRHIFDQNFLLLIRRCS